MSPPTDSTVLTPAEEAFAEFLALQEEGEVDFEAFCSARPEHEPALRRLHERWRAFDAAMSTDLAVGSGTAPGAAGPAAEEASAERLLERLRRDPSEESRFEARGEIGRGGMGRVLEVWDRDLRRSLAMKVLADRGARDPRSLARFLDEALVLGQLEHPGIVPVHELGLDAEGRVYFTMPFVRGEDLQAVIEHARAGRPSGGDGWTRERVLGVLLRVCEAVGYAHARGVVHRDLKPTNVMVGPFGETYVMDWGLARILGRPASDGASKMGAPPSVSRALRSVKDDVEEGDASPLVTREGDVVGTPVYMAPEQAHGRIERVGPRTDVYSIGAMLYHLLTGSRPYLSAGEEDSSAAVLWAVKSRAPRPVRALADDVPPELEAVCEKAMARDPGERYATPLELAADLRAYLEQRVVGAYETGAHAELRKWMVRNRRLALAIGAAAVAVLAGLGVSTALYFQSKANEADANEARDQADRTAVRLAEELHASHLAQGRLAARSGQLALAEDLLWREFLRRPDDAASRWALWELYALFPRRAAASAPTMPFDLELTPDGTLGLLLAGTARYGGGTTLRLVDSATLELLDEIPCGASNVQVAVDADGRRALTAGRQGEVRLWDLRTRREVARFDDRPGVLAVARLPDPEGGEGFWLLGDGDGVVAGLGDGGDVAFELRAPSPIVSLAVEPRRKVVAAGTRGGEVLLWTDPPRGGAPTTLRAHTTYLSALVFLPGGEVLAATSHDGTATFWRVPTEEGREPLASLAPSLGSLRAVAARGGRLAIGGSERVDLFDVGTPGALDPLEPTASLPVSGNVRHVALPAPDLLLAASVGGSLEAWDLAPDRRVRSVSDPGDGRVVCAGGGRLAVADAAGRVRVTAGFGDPEIVWDAGDPVAALALAPLEGSSGGGSTGVEGGVRLGVKAGGTARVVDLPGGEVRCTLPAEWEAGYDAIELSPDGELLVVSGAREGVPFGVFRAEDGEPVATLGREGETPVALRFSPTGDFFATTTRGRSEGRSWHHWVSIWSPEGEELERWDARSAWNLAVSPDGRLVAAGQWASEVLVWDRATVLETGEPAAVLRGHSGFTPGVDWHPTDPDLLASCSQDGTVRLWSVGSDAALLSIDAGGDLAQVRFTADGAAVATTGSDVGAALWDLTYFDRHVAGNAAFQIERLREELGDELRADEVRAWADAVLARPWPRLAP